VKMSTTTADAMMSAESGVRATVLDYFEGWYDADVERMRRALHPQLAKRSLGQDVKRRPFLATTTVEQMIWFTQQGEGRTSDPAERELSVEVVEVSAGIATAIVHSYDYVEYLHLLDTPDGWRIVNTLWRYADGRGPAA
jgi:hypothetical protein